MLASKRLVCSGDKSRDEEHYREEDYHDAHDRIVCKLLLNKRARHELCSIYLPVLVACYRSQVVFFCRQLLQES